MATSTLPKPRAKSSAAKPRPKSKAVSAASPDPIVPEAGAVYIVKLNQAPFWEPPRFDESDTSKIEVIKVTDTTAEPLTARDLAIHANANIGQYLVLVRIDDTKTEEIFWNDLSIVCFWEDNSTTEEREIDDHEQPFSKRDLRIVVRLVGALVDTTHSYGPTLAERLQLIAKVAELREASEDEQNNDVRVRPVLQ